MQSLYKGWNEKTDCAVFQWCSCTSPCLHACRMNNLPGNFFFFLNEFSAATVTGLCFCCLWRQKCWPFQAVDHIFHLILVWSDESKAVISPPTAERVGAQPCHPAPCHRAGVNAGVTLYEWLFTRCTWCTSVSRLSCCLPTGCLWWVFGWIDQNGLWPPRPLECVSVCLCVSQRWRCWACCLFK